MIFPVGPSSDRFDRFSRATCVSRALFQLESAVSRPNYFVIINVMVQLYTRLLIKAFRFIFYFIIS